MCVVIDLDVVCLICLQPSKDMHPIFTADDDDPEMQIAQKISILSELKLYQSNQTLPRKICTECLQDLKAAWRFRKNCKTALTIFQTIVKLDDVQPENTDKNVLTEQQIKVPHGLQIKRINVNNEQEKGKTAFFTKSTADEYIISSDKVGSSYEELEAQNYEENEDNEAGEFQILEDDQNDEFDDDDENTLVEYYITEDGTTGETTIKIDDNIPTQVNVEEEETCVEELSMQEKQTCSTNAEDIKKPLSEVRPKRQSVMQKETAKRENIVQTKTKGRIVMDSTNSSDDIAQPKIRQVKTRKRKSLSTERKTPKICEICGNSYRFQHALNAHMRRHYNYKPFPCECCDKAFVSNVELRRHMRVHTGQKPYACQYCERRFSDFGSRIKHERTHTGERPYLCVTCGKSFAYPHVLSVHIRTHTGEKRFHCDYCSKGFTKKAYLITHVTQHHNSRTDFQGKIQKRFKSKTFKAEDNIYTSEFVNEEAMDETEEYVDVNKGSAIPIIAQSQISSKTEADEIEIQEIEVQPGEFKIKRR